MFDNLRRNQSMISRFRILIMARIRMEKPLCWFVWFHLYTLLLSILKQQGNDICFNIADTPPVLAQQVVNVTEANPPDCWVRREADLAPPTDLPKDGDVATTLPVLWSFCRLAIRIWSEKVCCTWQSPHLLRHHHLTPLHSPHHRAADFLPAWQYLLWRITYSCMNKVIEQCLFLKLPIAWAQIIYKCLV